MRVFLDECVDWRLSRDILGHEILSARQMGWTAIRNIEKATIAVVVLRARSNRLADLKPFVGRLLRAIEDARPGVITALGDR